MKVSLIAAIHSVFEYTQKFIQHNLIRNYNNIEFIVIDRVFEDNCDKISLFTLKPKDRICSLTNKNTRFSNEKIEGVF